MYSEESCIAEACVVEIEEDGCFSYNSLEFTSKFVPFWLSGQKSFTFLPHAKRT